MMDIFDYEFFKQKSCSYFKFLEENESLTWITRDNRELNIYDMTDEHIENCYFMLEKNKYKDAFPISTWLEYFKSVLINRKIKKDYDKIIKIFRK